MDRQTREKELKLRIKKIKNLYKGANIERMFYPTRDKTGFYIHPKNKQEGFLNVGKKRVGIFSSIYDTADWNIKSLKETDDELRRALELPSEKRKLRRIK